MKISKAFLQKIIKEEIKRVLYEEHEEEKKREDLFNAYQRIDQLKDVIYGDEDDETIRKLIELFVFYRNYLTKNPTKNKELVTDMEGAIKKIVPHMSMPEVINKLQGRIDRQLYSFIINLLKRDKRMSAFSDKLDNYEMSITPDEQNVYQVYNKQDPDPGFMRVPKDDEAYDQEDVRKDRKTLTQS